VPPEVTVGLLELAAGAEELPERPVLPLEKPLAPDPPEPEVGEDPEDVPPEAEPWPLSRVLPDPGCSWATTTPMTIVAPLAARTAPRVRPRNRAFARSLFSGVWGGSVGVTCMGTSAVGTPLIRPWWYRV
jgi:hypothetical protein